METKNNLCSRFFLSFANKIKLKQRHGSRKLSSYEVYTEDDVCFNYYTTKYKNGYCRIYKAQILEKIGCKYYILRIYKCTKKSLKISTVYKGKLNDVKEKLDEWLNKNQKNSSLTPLWNEEKNYFFSNT